MSTDSSRTVSGQSRSSSLVKTLHYAVVAVLVFGGVAYVWMKPPALNPMADKRAAEALALVQTHQALGFPTILQAMNEHVRAKKERGEGVRLGEWRVKQVEGDLYEIRVQLRDQSVSGQWFEREFIWHAHLGVKKVNAASLPADGVTPKPPDSERPQTPAPPLPGAPPMPPMPGLPGV
ncbi:MAG: hypothetical protein RI101_08105 [Nitrospira sp.]|jgi:hypothetical protein|nr:hypothetical protein [Nitrospira sp.]